MRSEDEDAQIVRESVRAENKRAFVAKQVFHTILMIQSYTSFVHPVFVIGIRVIGIGVIGIRFLQEKV